MKFAIQLNWEVTSAKMQRPIERMTYFSNIPSSGHYDVSDLIDLWLQTDKLKSIMMYCEHQWLWLRR